MLLKTLVLAGCAFSFLLWSENAKAYSSVGYSDLSPEQRYAVDASFSDQSSYQRPAAKKVSQQKYYSSANANAEEYYSPAKGYEVKKAKKTIAKRAKASKNFSADDYDYDLPRQISTSEKVIIVDPKIHAWGAYSADGKLLRAGLATSGAKWCPDLHRPCKTRAGTFRIHSLGSGDCISSKYPLNKGGGAPMPYCMYFNGSQGLHGSNEVEERNLSHGCVRLRVNDAKWLRFNFSNIGTKVIIKEY